MNGWFIVAAVAIGYLWIAGYVSGRYPVKSMCCGAKLAKNRHGSFPHCTECNESSLWAKERAFFKVFFWPIAIPFDIIIVAGRKAAERDV